MIVKEGEAEKTNHFRSFVFEQRRQENSEEQFAKPFFFEWVRGSENRKEKENNRDKQQKRIKETTNQKNTQRMD